MIRPAKYIKTTRQEMTQWMTCVQMSKFWGNYHSIGGLTCHENESSQVLNLTNGLTNFRWLCTSLFIHNITSFGNVLGIHFDFICEDNILKKEFEIKAIFVYVYRK